MAPKCTYLIRHIGWWTIIPPFFHPVAKLPLKTTTQVKLPTVFLTHRLLSRLSVRILQTAVYSVEVGQKIPIF